MLLLGAVVQQASGEDYFDYVRRHIRIINIIGGSILLALGVLMISGVWKMFIGRMQTFIGSYTTVV